MESPDPPGILVSIIIPYVDEMDYLHESLASAINQQDSPAEIILICNNTTAIAPDITKPPFHHPSIRWYHEPQRGSAYARNRGLVESKGKWIQFLDVDDLLLPGKIRKQIECGEADIIASPHTYLFLSQKKVPSAWEPHDIWAGLLSSRLGSTSSMLWSRNALTKAGGWNPEYLYSQEYELMFRILQQGGTIRTCDEHLTIVRERPSGSISKSPANHPITGIKLRKQVWAYLVDHKMETAARWAAFQTYVFRNLRALYIREPQQAMALHRKYFSQGAFQPRMRSIPVYGVLYQLFGFESTEKIIASYRHLRDRYLPWLPRNK
jgi:glycosyltransferase involved in cell wall biosynthesis